jgi:hypothetical protein
VFQAFALNCSKNRKSSVILLLCWPPATLSRDFPKKVLPVVFKKQIRVTIEHGHANRRGDDSSSVAFWYQDEPHLAFPLLLPVEQRLPIFRKPFEQRAGVRLE